MNILTVEDLRKALDTFDDSDFVLIADQDDKIYPCLEVTRDSGRYNQDIPDLGDPESPVLILWSTVS